MGIIAKVLVSFTVTALSKVWLPRFHILSQVEAAAVTEEVSFTAFPAKIPDSKDSANWQTPAAALLAGCTAALKTQIVAEYPFVIIVLNISPAQIPGTTAGAPVRAASPPAATPSTAAWLHCARQAGGFRRIPAVLIHGHPAAV